MAYKRQAPLQVFDGGTGNESFDTYAVAIGGSASNGPLMTIVPSSSTTDILMSNGNNSAPAFQPISSVSNFRFQLLASDPGSPSDGRVWYNTTSNTFKGRANGVTYTFDVT